MLKECPQTHTQSAKTKRIYFPFSFIFMVFFSFWLHIFKETVKTLTTKSIRHRLQWPQMTGNTNFMEEFRKPNTFLGRRYTEKSPENALSFHLMLIPGLSGRFNSQQRIAPVQSQPAKNYRSGSFLFYFVVFFCLAMFSDPGKYENLCENVS